MIVELVPVPDISIIPFGSIQGALVGSPEEIYCLVRVVSGVEPDLVMINWMGPGGNTIGNDSRVTINPIISINNDYISTLEFTYLMEGDEGIYTCEVIILETTTSDYLAIQNLTGMLLMLASSITYLLDSKYVYNSGMCYTLKFACIKLNCNFSL